MEKLPKTVRDRLHQMQGGRGAHPEADLLTAFVEQKLAGAEREELLAHLAACADCREVAALSMPEVTPQQVTLGLPARSSWFHSGFMKFGVTAAAVTVVVAAVLVLEPKDSFQPGDLTPTRNKPVATAKPETISPQAGALKDDSQAEGAAAEDPGGDKDAVTSPAEVNQRKDRSTAQERTKVAELPATPSGLRQRADALTLSAGSGASGTKPMTESQSRDNRAQLSAGTAERDEKKSDAVDAVAPTAQPVAPLKSVTAPAENEPARAAAPPPSLKDGLAKSGEESAEDTAAKRSMESARFAALADDVPVTTGPSEQEQREIRSGNWLLTSSGQLAKAPAAGGSELGRLSAHKHKEEAGTSPVGKFDALVTVGSHVWVGGAGGSLYHSSDDGLTWRRVQGGWSEVFNITRIVFRDARRGEVANNRGEVWTTEDGGKSWKKKP